jgi:hypothetical protein
MADDEFVSESLDEERRSAAARLFDVRRVIGGLFVVYGVIVTIIGLLDTESELDKAQGVRINLWTGLGMLALGALFLLWQWLRPPKPRLLPRRTIPVPGRALTLSRGSWTPVTAIGSNGRPRSRAKA